ncbi:FaeA/PapI family transcriptional regulator [Aeromonas sp. MdU4]|uniref:FaeA/PapI family transcriptional regulator n=1 Tax=Aeromonas sp. MdU4 TaxID=3342819 RepID=UPI0035BA3BFC
MQIDDKTIIEFLAKQSPCSTATIGAELDMSVYKTLYRMRKLSHDGWVRKIKQGRGVPSLWCIFDEVK